MMNLIIFLIILCACYYFMSSIVRIGWWFVSYAWGLIKGLGYLLFLIIAAALILRWLIN